MSDTDETDGITLIIDPKTLEQDLKNEVPEIFVSNHDLADGDEDVIVYNNNKNLKRRDSQKSLSESIKGEIYTIGEALKRVPSQVSNGSHKVSKKAKHLNKQPIFDPFNKRSAIYCVITIILFLANIVADIFVAISLYRDVSYDTHWWFVITVCLIIVPAALVNLFSLVWFHQDHEMIRKEAPQVKGIPTVERFLILLGHCLGMGPAVRQFYILRTGLRERHQTKSDHSMSNVSGPYCLNHNIYKRDISSLDYYSLRKYRERDTAYLGLIASFLQDGPQLVLQLYILTVRRSLGVSNGSTAIFQSISVATSLLSLSWSMVSFEQASRWADPTKPKVSPIGNTVEFLWRFFMVASRVLTLALFASAHPEELLMFGGAHWGLMSMWLVMMGTNFCGSVDNHSRPLAELIYNVVIGWVFIFDIIHVKDGPTRIKNAVYYAVNAIEMGVLMYFWYEGLPEPNPDGSHLTDLAWYQITMLCSTPGCFILGLIALFIFYSCFHPAGKMPDMSLEAKLF